MLKIGIIGSGFGLYGLVPAFNGLKACKIVAVTANNKERLNKYYFSLGLKNVYSDWRSMLENETLDALAIAVTPNAQFEIAKVAIKKGIHIFAEKPLADTFEHAKILYDLAGKHKITHAIDFIYPEINEWQIVKKLVDNKTYGKLNHITVNWNFLSYDIENKIFSWKINPTKGGGALAFYFSHALYYLEFFAGTIKDIKSNIINVKKHKNSEVGVDLLLRFENQTTGAVSINCNAIGLNKHQIVFTCEKATILLENENGFFKDFKITICTDKIEKSVKSKKSILQNDQEVRIILVRQIAQRFIYSCINNKQMTPSIKEGLRVQQLIKIIRDESTVINT